MSEDFSAPWKAGDKSNGGRQIEINDRSGRLMCVAYGRDASDAKQHARLIVAAVNAYREPPSETNVERLIAAAVTFDANLSTDCDGPARDELRAAIAAMQEPKSMTKPVTEPSEWALNEADELLNIIGDPNMRRKWVAIAFDAALDEARTDERRKLVAMLRERADELTAGNTWSGTFAAIKISRLADLLERAP